MYAPPLVSVLSVMADQHGERDHNKLESAVTRAFKLSLFNLMVVTAMEPGSCGSALAKRESDMAD